MALAANRDTGRAVVLGRKCSRIVASVVVSAGGVNADETVLASPEKVTVGVGLMSELGAGTTLGVC